MMLACIRQPDFDCQVFREHPRLRPRSRWLAGTCAEIIATALTLLLAHPSTLHARPPGGDRLAPERSLGVIQFAAAATPAFWGRKISDIGAASCASANGPCRAALVQIDERDAGFRWVLDEGPGAFTDRPPGVLDENDVIVLRPEDCGAAVDPNHLPAHHQAVRVEITDPIDGAQCALYLLHGSRPTALAPEVTYDPTEDRLSSAKVAMAFTDGIPSELTLAPLDGNRIDRMKIRARAFLLWGWIRLERHEGDLTTEVVAWRRGPIRVIRQQHQRVRLGWGIRSPRFSSYTFFYEDFAEMPVGLRLNHIPTYFFGDIEIEVSLDFRPGFASVAAEHSPGELALGDPDTTAAMESLENVSWFALRAPAVTVVQQMFTSDSLASTRRRLVYRNDGRPNPPESVPGESPAIGFLIDRWREVDAGDHNLRAVSFALPGDWEPGRFMRTVEQPLSVRIVEPQGDEHRLDAELRRRQR